LTAVRLKAKKSSLHSASCSRKTKSMRTLTHQSPTPLLFLLHYTRLFIVCMTQRKRVRTAV
jgi:hypothetical protein